MEATAGQYHREMSRFIQEEIDQGTAAPSKSEFGKLSRLSPMQFQELATDVYDELKRRRSDNKEFPFLPVRDHYHPKRNQARQKLATLSPPKFVDLVHDVNEELKRRFPHKIEPTPQTHQNQQYDGMGAYGQQGQMYMSGQGPSNSFGAQQQAPPPMHSYGQYQPMSRSPPTSSGSNGQGFHNRGISPNNQPVSGTRGGSFAQDDGLDTVDRAASDLSHAIHSSQHTIPHNTRVPTPDTRGQQSTELDKLKNEYEMRLSAMRKRIGQLESQMLDHRSENPHENDSEQNLERLNTVLTQKNERLENEVRLLRDQLVQARADVPGLRQENERLKQERARFIDRERELKGKLDEARAKVRRLKTTSVFAMDHGDSELVPPPELVNPGGVIRPSSVRAFQEAVEALLSAVRSEHMDRDLPNARESVIAACYELKADIQAYQQASSRDPNTWPLPAGAWEHMPELLQSLDHNLDGLATATDKHLDSMGVLPISLLESAASHLATSVVDLVKQLKVCFDETKAAPRTVQAIPMPLQSNNNLDSTEPNDLEVSTDKIVEDIQIMLHLVREVNAQPNALYSALQRVVVSIRETINICRIEFSKVESGGEMDSILNVEMYDPDTAKNILDGMEKGHLQLTDQLNDISEAQEAAGGDDLDNEIVRALLSEMAYKQRLAQALINVGKLTRILVQWLE